MGNCLVMQQRVVRVTKIDREMIEYKAPMKVHQVVTEFSGHAISDALPTVREIRPDDAEMVGGQLYCLRPPPAAAPAVEKKRVRFASSETEGDRQTSGGVVRIKVVISKQDLELMLREGGFSADDNMVYQLHSKEGAYQKKDDPSDDDGNRSSRGWKPGLESIPEVY